MLREPSFPADEFEQLKKQSITSLESQLSEPAARASEALGQHFNIYPKGDPRYSPSLQEQLDGIRAVTLDAGEALTTGRSTRPTARSSPSSATSTRKR